MAVELSGSATSLTPMSSRRPTVRFSAYIFLMLVVLLAFAGVFVLYVQAEKKIDRANETRFLAIDLTQELRRSSDDLTRLARMFVVTGDPTYKAQYQEVLDIRDGKRLRPAFPGNENLGPEIGSDYRRLGAGAAVPLLDLMSDSPRTKWPRLPPPSPTPMHWHCLSWPAWGPSRRMRRLTSRATHRPLQHCTTRLTHG